MGAILTLYLAKHTIIPEFRPLYDTLAKEQEADTHKDHIKNTEKEIDAIQAKLKEESLPADQAERLKAVLDTSLSELTNERLRLQKLEQAVMFGQIITRSLGFIIYVILGGVFGALLAGYVKVEGLSGDLPQAFEAIVIGASWTSYLSIIGLGGVIKKTEEKYEADIKKITEENEKLKNDINSMMAKAKAQRAPKTEIAEESLYNDKVVAELLAKIDLTSIKMQKDLNQSRQMAKRTLSGF